MSCPLLSNVFSAIDMFLFFSNLSVSVQGKYLYSAENRCLIISVYGIKFREY